MPIPSRQGIRLLSEELPTVAIFILAFSLNPAQAFQVACQELVARISLSCAFSPLAESRFGASKLEPSIRRLAESIEAVAELFHGVIPQYELQRYFAQARSFYPICPSMSYLCTVVDFADNTQALESLGSM